MEKNFKNDHFEEFLRQNADGLRMRPSEKVWEGITKDLNKRRRRFGWGLGAFLLAACTFSYLSIDNVHRPTAKTVIAKNSSATKVATNDEKVQTAQARPTLAYRNEALIAQANSLPNIPPGNEPAVSSGAVLSPALRLVPADKTEALALPFADDLPGGTTNILPETARPQQAVVAADPLTIESVVNHFKPGRAKKRLTTQWYFTPTVSYRKLSENKSYLRSLQGSNAPSAVMPTYFDVNNMVTHKPGMGLELGFALRYPLSKGLRLRGGLQFNVTRYEIKAFNNLLEQTTIVLNSRAAGSPDSINRFSSLSPSAGYQSDWLQNFYLQLSVPIGIEYTFPNTGKVQLGIAGSVQPTYVLDDRAYLISTDYKRYAEVPELSRRWNVNTAMEAFVSYSSGKLNWQVGPQLRYQLLSSFATQYPVKENLFDYGLKVGISLKK